MPSNIQRSFAGGEIAPALYGRSDQGKYQSGLRRCENFTVMRHGGVSNRPGTKYIAQVKDSNRKVRLMKFVFNAQQTYVLEFGHEYIRVIKDGVQLTSGGSPYEIASPYQEEHLRDIQYVQSADVITLVHPNYAPRTLSRTGDTSWTLAQITYAPSITPPSKVVINGTAGNASSYVVTCVKELTYEESLPSDPVGNTNATASTSNKNTITVGATKGIYEFNVYKRINGVYGYVGTTRPLDNKMIVDYERRTRVSAPTANGIFFTLPDNHGYLVNEYLVIADATNTELNNPASSYRIYSVNGNVVEISDAIGGTGPVSGVATVGNRLTRTATTVTMNFPTGHEYNAGEPLFLSGSYLSGQFTVLTSAANSITFANPDSTKLTQGSAVVAMNSTFVDDGISADTTDTPPQARDPFPTSGNYPATVSYFQQRSVFASTTNEPEKVWLSRTGNFKNFSIRSPLQDDDAITFTIAGRQVNEVRHLIEVGQMLILTSGGEWRVMGDSDGVIKPAAINLKQEGYSGAAKITPIVIGNNALYIQARGNIARDLRYDLQTDGYNGRDLTVFAAHMFDGYQLVTWDYAQIPHSIVWTVRDDGVLLGLTYVREHDVWGWHRHTTDGVFEDVVCVPEGTEDAVYVVVRRSLNGVPVRYIERFAPRYTSQMIDLARDAFFVDCGATYDGLNTDSTHTLTVSAGTGTSVRDDMFIDANKDTFTPYSVGDAFQVGGIRFKVIEFIDERRVKVLPSQDVASVPLVSSQWTRMVDSLSGLDHLEGKEVAILADGDVHPSRTVIEGSITLNRPCGVVHVGLAYTSTIQTLAIDNPGGETLFDKNKIVSKVSMLVESSRGIYAGPDEAHLREHKQRKLEDYGEPTRLTTGLVEIQTVAQWDKQGLVMVQQKDPLPISVLAVVPQVSVSSR
jgi:hypothetical protein